MKVVSGGQTGVDRAALEFALENGIECGGWCPRGRVAEDGTIDARFPLRETDSAEYEERTRRNVIDSDATLIFARSVDLTGGTRFTRFCAQESEKPVLVVTEREAIADAAHRIRCFLADYRVNVLNIAGPRETQAPGLSKFVRDVLKSVCQKDD